MIPSEAPVPQPPETPPETPDPVSHRFVRPSAPTRVRMWPLSLAIFAVCVLSTLSPVLMGGDALVTGGGSVWRQILYLSIAVIVLFGLRPLVRPRRILAVPLGLIFPLIWAVASVAWAIVPSVSIRRLGLTIIIIWVVCTGVRAAGYERTVAIMRTVLIGALVANFAFVFFAPVIGTHQIGEAVDKNLIGDWRGFMVQKNYAGVACGVTCLAFLFNAREVPAYIRFPVLLGAAYFLYRTGSRTSITSALAAVTFGIVYSFYSARYRAVIVSFLAFLIFLVAVFSYLYVDPWWFIGGDDTLLSGRSQIWQLVWRYSVDHWTFGAGYGSFWDVGPDGPAFQYGKGWLWTIGEGHNGYLDILASMGIPGLCLVVFGTIFAPLTRLLLSRRANGQRGALPAAMIMFTVAHNGGESTLFDRDSISWMFMLIAIALVLVATSDLGIRFTRVPRYPRLWRPQMVWVEPAEAESRADE